MAKKRKEVLAHRHADKRRNAPTAEMAPVAREEKSPVRAAFERRNPDLDPQLVWRGKEAEPPALEAAAPPLYIQEKVHPKALIDDLLGETRRGRGEAPGAQPDLFADFNGLPEGASAADFYRHDANWSNRMILGDSLQVMASLAEREGLRGKVQCVYVDPPYGIRFNSNFQWSTTSRDVKDGKREHITREPEQVKAFRDTWRDGVHSYLSYLRDRLTAARELLAGSGSCFVQIGDENVHRVRAVMDEVFGDENFVALIPFVKTSGKNAKNLDTVNDYLLWYSRDIEQLKYRQLYYARPNSMLANSYKWIEESYDSMRRLKREEVEAFSVPDGKRFATHTIMSQGNSDKMRFSVNVDGNNYSPSKNTTWKTNATGIDKLSKANRLFPIKNTLTYKRYADDFPVVPVTNWWSDTVQSTFAIDKKYVVETYTKVIQRCVLMTTDPGDLVLDPTCGAGTTAYVAEQWGRRWITIDTSRVALALARARIMGARYPYYLLADSPEGRAKEAEIERRAPSAEPTFGDIRQGFVYERVPHVTLKSIANNAEIDVIHEKWQETLEPLRARMNALLGQAREEWEIPREAGGAWPEEAREAHAAWREARIARQKEMDAAIARAADFEYLYDRPYQGVRKARVAGPFTVESVSPHRYLGVDADGELVDGAARANEGGAGGFCAMVLEHLARAGVRQAHREDAIAFSSLAPWPGELVCAEGRWAEGERERRAGVFVGPEFGTVHRADLAAAAREAAEAGFDALVACAFSYEARAAEFSRLGRVPVLKARMNADLHMAKDLKNTGGGNLFVVFGEPDIDLIEEKDGRLRVKINGVDVFHPASGEVRSDDASGIACWLLDTDYDEESFFVRHAYFLGANDPYRALRTTLRAEVSAEAWATLRSDTSRPFARPASGRVAVKVINHLGDEVMKVFRV